MKSEYELFKEGDVPSNYIEAHEALLHFINKAWGDGVYISTRISAFVHHSKMYLDIAGSTFPMVSLSELEQFIKGQHPDNEKVRGYGESGELKEDVMMPNSIKGDAFDEILRQCKLSCSQLSPLLHLFKKFADEFHAFEVRHEREAHVTCFAKLNDVWFSNIGNSWRYEI